MWHTLHGFLYGNWSFHFVSMWIFGVFIQKSVKYTPHHPYVVTCYILCRLGPLSEFDHSNAWNSVPVVSTFHFTSHHKLFKIVTFLSESFFFLISKTTITIFDTLYSHVKTCFVFHTPFSILYYVWIIFYLIFEWRNMLTIGVFIKSNNIYVYKYKICYNIHKY